VTQHALVDHLARQHLIEVAERQTSASGEFDGDVAEVGFAGELHEASVGDSHTIA
jgi:hypothetical protein